MQNQMDDHKRWTKYNASTHSTWTKCLQSSVLVARNEKFERERERDRGKGFTNLISSSVKASTQEFYL